jgi:hypothetical protein
MGDLNQLLADVMCRYKCGRSCRRIYVRVYTPDNTVIVFLDGLTEGSNGPSSGSIFGAIKYHLG